MKICEERGEQGWLTLVLEEVRAQRVRMRPGAGTERNPHLRDWQEGMISQ